MDFTFFIPYKLDLAIFFLLTPRFELFSLDVGYKLLKTCSIFTFLFVIGDFVVLEFAELRLHIFRRPSLPPLRLHFFAGVLALDEMLNIPVPTEQIPFRLSNRFFSFEERKEWNDFGASNALGLSLY